MADHIMIPATHPWMMRKREAIRQMIEFLREGAFDRHEEFSQTPFIRSHETAR